MYGLYLGSLSISEIISLSLGIISIILGCMGVFLFHYFENIKSAKIQKKQLKEIKFTYLKLIEILDDNKIMDGDKITYINIFKQSIVFSIIENIIKWELVAKINLIYAKWNISQIVNLKNQKNNKEENTKIFHEISDFLKKDDKILKILETIKTTKKEEEIYNENNKFYN